jgi:hypothetical protein
LHQTRLITPDFGDKLKEVLATTKQLQLKAKEVRSIESRNETHDGFQEEFATEIAGLVTTVIKFAAAVQKIATGNVTQEELDTHFGTIVAHFKSLCEIAKKLNFITGVTTFSTLQ